MLVGALSVFVALLLAGTVASPASAALTSHCSNTGDVCYSVHKEGQRTKLAFKTFSFSGPIKICVQSQTSKIRLCKQISLKADVHGSHTANVDLKNRFENPPNGPYCASFIYANKVLGPRLCFEVTGGRDPV